MSTKETLERAYGHIPKDLGFTFNIDFPYERPLRYFWIKVKRFFTR